MLSSNTSDWLGGSADCYSVAQTFSVIYVSNSIHLRKVLLVDNLITRNSSC